jgi:ABC-type bacteriocin/lantibiotic exporter with double-glycine peptidase domain
MKIVYQREKYDCGIACVAMIIQRYAGYSYEASYDSAKKVMFDNDRIRRTYTYDLKIALAEFGVKVGYRRIGFKKLSPTDMGLPFDAILSTKQTKSGNWHWMVWDFQNKILLDPWQLKKIRTIKHYIKIN